MSHTNSSPSYICVTSYMIACRASFYLQKLLQINFEGLLLACGKDIKYHLKVNYFGGLQISADMMTLYFIICVIGIQNVFCCHQKWTRQSLLSSGSSKRSARPTFCLNLSGGVSRRQRLPLSRRRGKALSGDLSCPDYNHFYSYPCHGVIENVFSWQECGQPPITNGGDQSYDFMSIYQVHWFCV